MPKGTAFQNFVFNPETRRSILNRGKPWNCRMAISHCFGQAANFPGCPPNNKLSWIFTLRFHLYPPYLDVFVDSFIRSGRVLIFGPCLWTSCKLALAISSGDSPACCKIMSKKTSCVMLAKFAECSSRTSNLSTPIAMLVNSTLLDRYWTAGVLTSHLEVSRLGGRQAKQF